MARPKKEINWAEVELRLEAGNTAKIIASVFNIDLDTFYIRFKQQYNCSFQDYPVLYGSFRERGKENIAAAQYKIAMKGSNNMLIHLGKEWLGQGKGEVTDKDNLATLLKMMSEGKLKQKENEVAKEVNDEMPATESDQP